MKKKKKIHKEGRSLKTFFIYFSIVFIVILISSGIKAYFVIRESKFDGKSLNLEVSQNKKAIEILGFNKTGNSTSILKLDGNRISDSSVGEQLGVMINARLDSTENLAGENPDSILTKAFFQSGSVKTDLSIFDILQLLFFAKNVTNSNKVVRQIKLPASEAEIDNTISELFKNETINSENISIEIINATDKPGLGKRLERILNNSGANVIAVLTSREIAPQSMIQYSGNGSYTLDEIKRYLNFKLEKSSIEQIANIVIIIGEDSKDTTDF